jgi:hypothetical protein
MHTYVDCLTGGVRCCKETEAKASAQRAWPPLVGGGRHMRSSRNRRRCIKG